MPLFPGDIPAGRQPRPVGPGFNESVRRFSLRGILDDRFSGELDRLTESQPDLETNFLEALRSPVNFEDFRGELSEFAESVTSDVFGPGGAVQGAINQATPDILNSGMSPFGGTAARTRNDILRGATDQVSNAIGQQAGKLAGIASQNRTNDIASRLAFTELQAGRADSLRESLFGGQATIENLGLARESQDLNRRMIEQALRQREGGGGFGSFFGNLGGGLLGATLGPIGATVGSRAGGAIGDALFGGGGSSYSPSGGQGGFQLDTRFLPQDNTNPLYGGR